MENTYSVYMHINKINNKKYIGMTKRKPNIRFGKNGKNYYNAKRFYEAIKKYGWNNFEHIILYENLTKEEASKKEIELIKQYYTTDKDFGYNIAKGGNGGNNKPIFPVKKYDLYGRYICTYESAAKAALDVDGERTSITFCCKNYKNNKRIFKHKNFLWSYADENITEGYKRKDWKAINQYDLCGNFIKKFINVASASKEVKGDCSAIIRCANNHQKYAYGYKWKWEDKI